ncbi:MAG: hypothetical protein HYT35_01010 [Candidatus Staskawiczbacteria bacterium]|nr:hypothetical protein [Candidatus Staskawiczbacteria bacterium]
MPSNIIFCWHCGEKLSTSVQLKMAMFNERLEEKRPLVLRLVPSVFDKIWRRCSVEIHFQDAVSLRLFDEIIKLNGLAPRSEEEQINFCGFCGKELPKELPTEWQIVLQQQLSYFR